MPISDNVLTPRQAELGKIKIGRRADKQHTAKGSGRAYAPPQKLETKDGPYFLITKTIRDQHGSENFIVDTALMQTLAPFKDKDGMLRRIPFMLDSDDIEESFPSGLGFYRKGKLWCANNVGQGIATRFDGDKPRKVECTCEWLGAEGDEKCKPGGTLWCTILAGRDTVIGMRHAFRTHGWNSIRAIRGGLLAIKKIVGTICGVKMWLVVQHHLTKRRDGKWQRVPLVSVMIEADDIPAAQAHAIAAAQRRMTVLQIASNPAVLGLPAPGQNETPQQQEEIAAEWFHPGESEGADVSDVEDDDEEEVIDYDPLTGVVRDPNAEPEPESRRSTQPAMDAATTAYDTDRPGQPWGKDHPGRSRLGQLLRQLASARGLEINNEAGAQRALRDVIAEMTERKFGKPILFGNLTNEQAGILDCEAQAEIDRREAEDREDAEGDGDDDAIPG